MSAMDFCIPENLNDEEIEDADTSMMQDTKYIQFGGQGNQNIQSI